MKNVNIKTIIGIILLVAAFICLGYSFKDLIIDKTKRSMEIVEDIAKESQKEKYYNPEITNVYGGKRQFVINEKIKCSNRQSNTLNCSYSIPNCTDQNCGGLTITIGSFIDISDIEGTANNIIKNYSNYYGEVVSFDDLYCPEKSKCVIFYHKPDPDKGITEGGYHIFVYVSDGNKNDEYYYRMFEFSFNTYDNTFKEKVDMMNDILKHNT